jgi:hypothetical protein
MHDLETRGKRFPKPLVIAWSNTSSNACRKYHDSVVKAMSRRAHTTGGRETKKLDKFTECAKKDAVKSVSETGFFSLQ